MIILCAKNQKLNNDIRYLKGVGAKRKVKLNNVGIHCISDALLFFPRRFEDRKNIKKISECMINEECTIIVKQFSEVFQRKTKGNLLISTVTFKDETGTMQGTWFNAPYIKKYFKSNKMYALYGTIKMNYGKITMVNPKIKEVSGESDIEIEPVYPLTANIKQYEIRKVISKALEFRKYLNESLPQSLLKENNLVSLQKAIKNIHRPDDFECFKKARSRLVFEELFYLQLSLLNIKKNNKNSKRKRKYINDKRIKEFITNLEYELTKAQKRAVKDIENDFKSEYTMNRLIQGDVGSGKTIVALIAILKVVFSGYQAAMMVPTSILAIQHFRNFKDMLKNFNLNIELLYSKANKKEKEKIVKRLKTGEIDIIVGTHSLIQDDVEFKDLGLVITDEQHRFGVEQRKLLKNKSGRPDVLIMTATPIPRTLALVMYADTDLSIIDEIPKGRRRVKTYVVGSKMRKRVSNFVIDNIKKGRQAYIICPMVENDDENELKSVIEYYETAKKTFLNGFKVEYMHGKMKPDEKEKRLLKFANGEIDALISTTVIEVGVNVPNANIMIIENAERYGLAQLHQLRGRVGRGHYQSYCILFSESKTEKSRKRLDIMKESSDGFYISEMDLKLRGPGEFFGTMQHGIPPMKIANFYEDMDILKFAQKKAIDYENGNIPISFEESEIINKIIQKIKGGLKDA